MSSREGYYRLERSIMGKSLPSKLVHEFRASHLSWLFCGLAGIIVGCSGGGAGLQVVPVPSATLVSGASIELQIPNPPIGIPTTSPLFITLFDKSGHPIVGQYPITVNVADVDVFGNSSVVPNKVSDSSTVPIVTFNGYPSAGTIVVSGQWIGSLRTPFLSSAGIPLPVEAGHTFGIGPDAAIWFNNIQLYRIASDNTITSFSTPTGFSNCCGITAGPDGNLWIGAANGYIFQVALTGGVRAFQLFPNFADAAEGIIVGPDGALWFPMGTDEAGRDRIGRITTVGSITYFKLPYGGSNPSGIAVGQDGAMYFGDSDGLCMYNAMGRVDIHGHVKDIMTSPYDIPIIYQGQGKTLWSTPRCVGGALIAEVSTQGLILRSFTVPTPPFGFQPPIITGLAFAPNGDIWYTDYNNSAVGRVTPDGQVIAFPTTSVPSYPEGIIYAPNGKVYFSGGPNVGVADPNFWQLPTALPRHRSTPNKVTPRPDHRSNRLPLDNKNKPGMSLPATSRIR
jgi:virginiamycin B lyase